MTTTAFAPPSPGAWELERTHATRPISRYMWDVFPPSMVRGFADATREYGALLDYMELAVIDGFLYSAVRPVGAPKTAKAPPPKFVFKLLVKLHPEIRRRVRRAEEVFRDRLWRKELEWWDTEVKPSLAKDGAALIGEDLSSSSKTALADHVKRVTEFARRTIYFHHRMNCCAILPLGDFLVHVTGWTGLASQDILVAMRGRSPLSAGATTELEALRVALVSDGDAMTTVMSDRAPGEILTQLEGRPTAVGTAMRAYLAVVGLRVVGGYDVADRHGRERPDLLVNIIRAAVTAVYSPTQGREAEQAIASIRARVPEAHRVEFDALLAEALLTYRVRDERNFCSDAIGVGALRRALLAVGSRLQAEGRVHAPEHLVDASEAEVIALLGGSATPSADELAARFTRRMATTLADAPDRLGFEPSGPPPADWLPPGAARTQRAVDLVLNLMFAVPPKSNSATRQLKGFGVSPGVYEGPVRVISDVTQLGDVQAGEILVTSSTGPTFNIILPLLKAIVTERGGALSHAAIVAREYGIPAIVGCPGAMAAVKTGSRIKVDGTKGEMWVLD